MQHVTHGATEVGEDELFGPKSRDDSLDELFVRLLWNVCLERYVREVWLRGDVDRHVPALEQL